MRKWVYFQVKQEQSSRDLTGRTYYHVKGKLLILGQSYISFNFAVLVNIKNDELRLRRDAEIPPTQCGNFGNLLSRIFGKNLVKETFY